MIEEPLVSGKSRLSASNNKLVYDVPFKLCKSNVSVFKSGQQQPAEISWFEKNVNLKEKIESLLIEMTEILFKHSVTSDSKNIHIVIENFEDEKPNVRLYD